MKRWIIIASSAVVVLILAAFLIKNSIAKEKEVVEIEVQKGSFEVEITTTGELKAENSENIMGPSTLRQAGIYQVKITDIIPEGTVVKEGDYVATLDRTEITSKLKELETALELEQSKLEQAKLDTALELRQSRTNLINLEYALEEARYSLSQSKYEPPAIIRQAEVNVEKAERELSETKHNYTLKQRQSAAKVREIQSSLSLKLGQYEQMMDILKSFVIRAPKNGMLIYARDWSGNKIAVGGSISAWAPIVATLPDLSKMSSKTFVNEVDISKVKVGQHVKIGIDAFPDKKFTGRVLSVANVGQEKSNSDAKVFEVEIAVFERDTTLRPSMTTSNTIKIASMKEVLSVPIESLHDQDSVVFVLKKKSKKVVRQEIIKGLSNDNAIIIEHGLEEGDKIILNKPEDIADYEFVALSPEIKEKYKQKIIPADTVTVAEEEIPDEVQKMLKAAGGKAVIITK